MIPELPTRPGAYRWFYADFTEGDFTAVAIFMVGSVFSPRYSRSWRRGARPIEHCAVNLAVYQSGVRRHWILTEYPSARADEHELFIGRSCFRSRVDGAIEVELDDREACGGRPVRARLTLEPEVPPLGEQRLVKGAPHFWQPLAAKAKARFELPQDGVALEGRGYHDTNHGDEPLGGSVPGWTWLRLHTATDSRVGYWPRTPGGAAPALWVEAGAAGVRLLSAPPMAPMPTERTGWQLAVPSTLGLTRSGARPHLLESSPFYARLEAQDAEVHSLAEVADFARFHRADVRWMAHFRTRRVLH